MHIKNICTCGTMGHSCNKLRLFAQVRQMIASNLLQCGTMGYQINEYGHKYIGEQDLFDNGTQYY